ncbi:Acetyltransferase [subsurface metagenome]
MVTYKIAVSDCELEGAFEVRKQVFVEEQGISEDLELDEHDMEAMHMVVKDGERIVGTARVLFLAASQAKLERMAILKLFRHRGIGKGIISFLDEEFTNRGIEQVVLHAQYSAVNFYKSCGFEESGSPFWEAGIKHVKMQKRL